MNHYNQTIGFISGMKVNQLNDGCIKLTTKLQNYTIEQPTSWIRVLVNELSNGDCSVERFIDSTISNEGPSIYAHLHHFLNQLDNKGLLMISAYSGQEKLMTIEPTSPNSSLSIIDISSIKDNLLVDDITRVTISKFCFIRKSEEQLVWEHPLSNYKIYIYNEKILHLLYLLAKPISVDELVKNHSFDRELVTFLINWLFKIRFICDTHQEEKTILKQWEFHDLLFHTRSRLGRHMNSYGGVFPFRHDDEPLPAVKQLNEIKGIQLYKPDYDNCWGNDIPFGQVLESRKSDRIFGDKGISFQQLGEFLYRCARVKWIGQTEHGMEISKRPYPSGGSVYDLEIYLVVNKCEGLEKGIYHYNPQKHSLHELNCQKDACNELLKQAATIAHVKEDLPQVYIILTSRFSRVAWKYRSMSYALTLKNVGILYQTMYLTATALDLSACALGGGNSDLFASVTGIDYYSEPMVGEFIIGSKTETL